MHLICVDANVLQGLLPQIRLQTVSTSAPINDRIFPLAASGLHACESRGLTSEITSFKDFQSCHYSCSHPYILCSKALPTDCCTLLLCVLGAPACSPKPGHVTSGAHRSTSQANTALCSTILGRQSSKDRSKDLISRGVAQDPYKQDRRQASLSATSCARFLLQTLLRCRHSDELFHGFEAAPEGCHRAAVI